MRLRSIKIRSKANKGWVLAVAKSETTHIMDNFGNLLPKDTTLFAKDPRGNWIFSQTDKGYDEFTLTETEDWLNKTPKTAPDAVLQINPNIIKKYGPDVHYVTLEEALMVLYKKMKAHFKLRDLWIVSDKSNKDVIRFLLENGWDKSHIENWELAFSQELEEVKEEVKIAPVINLVESDPVEFDTEKIKEIARKVETPITKKGRPSGAKNKDKDLIEVEC